MKLVRYGKPGSEKPGMIDTEGRLRNLSQHVSDIDPSSLPEIDALRELPVESLPLVEGDARFGPCVANVGKFMCIGLNYSDHAAETGAQVPEHPMLFMKATSAINGPNDDISLPRGSQTTDWEAELAVVIGKTCKYATRENALDHVAGYCIANDVSERTFQKHRSGQFTKGKSCDTFGPLGPWLVTRDEIEDPQQLAITLDVNGERMQTGNTSAMIFSVIDIIEHLSQMFTLHPGDVLATGTPSGVGAGMKPEARFLKPGDVIDIEIEGLGRQKQNIVMDA